MIKEVFRSIAAITAVTLMSAMCVGAVTVDPKDTVTSDAALNYAAEVITDKYSDYYTIHDVAVNVLNTTVENGIVERYVEINFGRKLLADEASDLPYVAGSIDAMTQLNGNLATEGSAVDVYVADLINELEKEYIGKIQSTSVYAYVSAPNVLNMGTPYEEQCEVWVEDMNGDKVSPDVLAPDSAELMYQKGQETVSRIASGVDAMNANVTINDDIKSYDRVDARDYARNWSCALELTEDHETCHNPNYDFYDGERGGDCANFVSQCLYEGGLPTDTTWYKNSATWVRGADICNYVEDNNLFFKSENEMKAFAGSIIRWSTDHHVGLVDQNDTVTMTFCAHNKCRRSYPWTGQSVYFFVPYWDSYADTWTEY